MMNKKGFTLIELIAVLLILGILATAVASRYIGFADNTNQQVEQTLKTAQDRKDGLYQYAGIEERTEQDTVNDVKTEEENSFK